MPNFDSSWTLFLDRDGVINIRLPGDYVRSPDEFRFIEGSKQAIVQLNRVFGKIVVVTNQQGVGKGLFTEKDLEEVHGYMLQEIKAAGGLIDKVYCCPDLAIDDPPCRKPNPGMALQAKKDFPEIDFTRSVMAGDSISDMQFGQNLGMVNVLIETKADERQHLENAIKKGLRVDFRFPDLSNFAHSIVRG